MDGEDRFPAESPKCVDTLFSRSVNIGTHQTGCPVSHAMAHPYSLSLIDPEHDLKFQGKPEYPISQTGWSNFDKFSLHRRRASVAEIGPTSTQVASGLGKARTVANSETSDDEDG
jgi:hypothetical protein